MEHHCIQYQGNDFPYSKTDLIPKPTKVPMETDSNGKGMPWDKKTPGKTGKNHKIHYTMV